MLHAVIMAGGSGKRFWPLSRQNRPKQFLAINGQSSLMRRSLIQQAFDRCQPLIPPERTWVVTNQRFDGLTKEHLSQLSRQNILHEPCARNTAPCLGLAALHLLRRDPDATMLVLSADHLVTTTQQFHRGVKTASQLVEADSQRLVLFGIKPTFPATGFGYIERGDTVPSFEGCFDVERFREKPDEKTAEAYLDSGKFLWNCGIFCWRADHMMSALKQHEPEMTAHLLTIAEVIDSPTDYQERLNTEFPKIKSQSIDYAILERESNIAVVQAPFQWDDVGSWDAMARTYGTDESGNTTIGRSVLVETQDTIVRGDEDHLIAVHGMSDCIIVQSGNSVLVVNRRDENAMRELMSHLQEQGHDEFL